MIDFKNIEGLYFVGIGGIGMSALAFYFNRGGFSIAGYDRSESMITHRLEEAGCKITYNDEVSKIPDLFRNVSDKSKVIIVYTPAIPAESQILSFFRGKGYTLHKRSEILGEISLKTDTLAVAGTHGKTTISTMIAHLLKQSHIDCSAFLGGISKNYDSNLLIGEGRYTVMEADEFDRSFHRLSPLMAVITSLDADHLDIYGNRKSMIVAYNEFCKKIRKGGILVINRKIQSEIIVPEGVTCYTYGPDPDADYQYFEIVHQKDYYSFNIKTPGGLINDLHFPFPGIVNIENLTAAVSIALQCGVTEQEIRKAIVLFQGVRRRFDIRINRPGLAFVDDYAHHPEEIRAFIKSVKEYFRGRKITGIFQPHLFSRTRDHAEGFAAILDELDEPILLPIYPAREKPIAGVTSQMLLDLVNLQHKTLVQKDDLIREIRDCKPEVLLTLGAGDIDRFVEPITELLTEPNV